MRKSTWVMVVVSAIAIILTASSVITVFLLLHKVSSENAASSVKESLPQQTVLTRVPGVDGPAVKANGTLVVSARKCNLTNKPLLIKGDGSFAALEPPGLSVLIGQGEVTRPPGCTTKIFHFVIPDAVRERVNTLARENKTQTWQLFGTDQPLEGGATLSWSSQPFVIVPDSPR